MEDYFRSYSPYLRLIHLANIKDFGMGNDHATAFTCDDREMLSDIMKLVLKYCNPNTLLTIETREDNYLECKNYITTREEINIALESSGGRMIV